LLFSATVFAAFSKAVLTVNGGSLRENWGSAQVKSVIMGKQTGWGELKWIEKGDCFSDL
jgi:hypothetical protein